MATFRVGVGSFNINDGAVGVGTEGSGHGNLKVEGTLKSNDIDVLGVSTFTRYSGFYADEININNRDFTLTGEVQTVGDVVIETDSSITVGMGSTACVASAETLDVKHHFSFPSGNTLQRNEISGYNEGTIRFNSDLETLEFFDGSEWRQFTCRRDFANSPTTMGRGIFAGGNEPAPTGTTDEIVFLQVSTGGRTQDFGSLVEPLYGGAAASSSTRGLVMGGWNDPTNRFNVNYITLASQGNATDFGSDNSGGWGSQGASDSVRALSAGGGYPSATTDIDMFFFSTVGSHIDYADITAGRNRGTRGMCNPVRAVFTGTYGPDSTKMDTKLIANSANTTDFGDMYFGLRGHSCCSDTTRGIAGGSNNSPIASPGYGGSHSLEFITISSTGTSQYFGDLYKREIGFRGAAQNMTRGLWAGGAPATIDNGVDAIIIQTTGNAVEFGDLSSGATNQQHGLNDSHGGVGGY